ncbi:dimethylamine corrinoid protein 3, partial [Candidatus Bathyarchaeota archaeon]
MSEAEIIEGLKKAVLNYDVEAAAELAKKVVDAGIDPVKAIEEGLAAGIREVGEKFGRKEIFLPELIMAAETMNSGLKVLEPEIKKRKTERKSMG